MVNYSYYDSIYDKPMSSPLVRIVAQIGKPCVNNMNQRFVRDIELNNVYLEGDNCPDIFGDSDMNNYQEAGFNVTELLVLQQNGNLYRQVTEQFQSDQISELNKNNYQLYSKSYALWKASCQS